MTQCRSNSKREQGQITLDLGLGKRIEATFDGGLISSDGGMLLLRKADNRLGLTEVLALCFGERRRPDSVKHPMLSLIRQRVYAIAAGYEDCNDATRLRFDAMHNLAIGKRPQEQSGLASQPTLSRWENSVDEVSLKLQQTALVMTYINAQRRRPKVIRLSIDTTVDEVHGYQQLSFYNGFYGSYCYVPLFIFTEDGFPLAALLRQGNAGKYEGTLRMLRPVIEELRRKWPGIRIEFSADSAFAAPEIYDYCEQERITYYIGIAGNSALQSKSEKFVNDTKALYEEFAGPTEPLGKYAKQSKKARKDAWRRNQERIRFSSKTEGRMQEHAEEEAVYIRKYTEFEYQARGWPKERRIVVKAEYSSEGPDVRYVVTNAKGCRAGVIYERYCKRSQCENWIKDLKTHLKSDRTSCQEFHANQLRLLLHVYAYILLWEIKRKAKLETSTVTTIQLKYLKVGVLVKETARKIWLNFASCYPWQDEFRCIWNAL